MSADRQREQLAQPYQHQHPTSVSGFARLYRFTTIYIAVAVTIILIIMVLDLLGLLPEISTHITTERN